VIEIHEGWVHSPEDKTHWASWTMEVGDFNLMVIRTYKAGSASPSIKDEYSVYYKGAEVSSYPLTTPIEEVLAMAIAEVRLQ
jgi:hypothetical protein